MPDSVSEERRKLMRHYGAEVVLIHDAGNIGECIEECLNTALKMAEEDPRVFVPQQFENPANPAVHRSRTAVEILEQADCKIDGFCSGIGTGGTITHHHAVGTDHLPWMGREISVLGLQILKAVKKQLDPAGILNPGKTFDLNAAAARESAERSL